MDPQDRGGPPSVVVGLAGAEGVADGELRGGGSFGSKVVLGLQWFPIKIEQGGVFTGGRKSFWWREWRGGGSGGTGVVGMAAAAEFAGDGEEDLPGSIGCHGRATRAC